MTMRRLWIPGPTEVAPEILEAMAGAMIGHRDPEIRELVGAIRPGLQRLLGAREVFFMTSSATTVMESGLRNLVGRRALVASCGEFGKRWHEIGKACGIATDLVEAQAGEPVTPAMVREALRPGEHDALCLTWSETSTAVLNPVADLVRAAREVAGDVSILVDAVTAVAALEIDFDALGADLLLAGVQKAMAMPPGLSVYALSEAALAKAAQAPHRGYVTDFIRNKASMDKDETPATPSVSHLFALRAQLGRIHGEGMPARAARHRKMSDMACAWGERHGHEVLARAGFRSPTVTCLRSPIPSPKLIAGVKARCGAQIGPGYGPFKDTHVRIGHMGEHSPEQLEIVLQAMRATIEAGG